MGDGLQVRNPALAAPSSSATDAHMTIHPHALDGREKRSELAARIRRKDFIAAPGVFDLISAKIADAMHFDALYMTGYGTVASHLGLPDAGLASYADMVNRVQRFTSVTRTPMICDADTGYGGLLNVMHTVRGYEAAGACIVQLEDQVFPKKCGHMPGRQVVDAAEMVKKIRVAVESRSDPNLLILARTDARTTLGLDEALRRGEMYAKAGADVLFIESPESPEEMATITRTFDTPLLANMVEGGSTPILTKQELMSLGFSLAIFPATGFLASAAALQAVYGTLKQNGSTAGMAHPLFEFQAFSSLMGFDEVAQFDSKYA
jgi:2-methylisocitrate lyase-like PEP mutase family enzyme